MRIDLLLTLLTVWLLLWTEHWFPWRLMLRKDLVEEVEKGRFHVWAVSTIEEGLEVLTGTPAGARDESGAYPADSVFGRADACLKRLAEQVVEYGVADAGSTQ